MGLLYRNHYYYRLLTNWGVTQIKLVHRMNKVVRDFYSAFSLDLLMAPIKNCHCENNMLT